MKLTTEEGYALRAMVFLAKQTEEDHAFSLTEIAKVEKLPLHFLEQIFIKLRRQELVISLRGALGGYRLSRPAELISAFDVMQAVGDTVSLLDCNRDFCPQGDCSMSPFLLKLQHTITTTLQGTSLHALANPTL
ncbi:hypothetical protein AUK40_02060 [Candidatus Wirthbacteria bacterium CG2_30_54_11]|uniref:Rrf2 family transcriptional regulator n=1 Tax=Candidatus Wirthbacteria bacterium CG2_30_54_11 TaxID=1817892 RepID=A0A1J5IMX4_9BACT|nr:MAG: hypothetical protein AUK40_02060 [Candidatus Wirthbacteria bacterium CG2_30_54_11]